MVEVGEQELIKQCCDILRNEMGCQQSVGIPELAMYMVRTQARLSLTDGVTSILQEGASPSSLLCAVMKCQLLILEKKISVILKHPQGEQVQALKTMIEHFNYIETTIMQTGEEIWEARIDAVHYDLKVEHQHRILDVSMQIWKHQKQIKLLNYYKGLPVQVLANIERVEAVEQPVVTVHSSTALGRVLAMQKNEFVLTPDAEDEALIHLQVKREQGEKVSFLVKALSTIKKRQYFRLEPIESMTIQLYRNKKIVGRGKVLDLSLKHMDISMPTVKNTVFEVNEIVDICFLLQKKDVKGCAWYVMFVCMIKKLFYVLN